MTYSASLAYPNMVFIESSSFTLEVRELLSDESYAALQRHLIVYPEAGAVIQDTGGGYARFAGVRDVEAKEVVRA